MIVYLGRIFCTASECANFQTCDRALTQDVKDRAHKWWGSNEAPIARFADPSELQCYTPTTNAKPE